LARENEKKKEKGQGGEAEISHEKSLNWKGTSRNHQRATHLKGRESFEKGKNGVPEIGKKLYKKSIRWNLLKKE